MKTILSSWTPDNMKKLGILLITVALVAGMVGCEPLSCGGGSSTPVQYDLIIDNTTGGSVTTLGVGNFTYDAGTVVALVAEAEVGYRFVEWTGDVGTIADVYAAETTITMSGAYTITANFIAQYDLTIDSTDGGEVITPGEGTFTYDAGTVVDLVAEAEESYTFVQWTGDVGTIADIDAAETTITMSGNYSITANFILFAGGSGTAEDPYQMADWRHLDNLRNYLSSYFILINDLDLSSIGYTELASETGNEGKGWEPIGTELYSFTGSFNGQGYETHDLFIDRPDEEYVGLFGIIAGSAVIEDIGVVNADVTGMYHVGGLLGYNNHGTVTDCYSSGSVTGNDEVGGLVGYNDDGTITNSYSSGSVSGMYHIGGLVGYNDEGTVTDSYSSANVTGELRVGGLVGRNDDGTVSSYSTGSVTGGDYVGGLVGYNCGTGIVSNSYSSANVTGDDYIGGLVGYIDEGTVSNSYSTGNVTGDDYVGGLVGYTDEGTVSNCFWDTQTSGQATSAGGTDKTTAEMKNVATFSGAGWNIIAVANPGTRNPAYIWNIVDDETYPFLSWQPV